MARGGRFHCGMHPDGIPMLARTKQGFDGWFSDRRRTWPADSWRRHLLGCHVASDEYLAT
eukprot:scaffold183_cov29-Tisochrysis_lutea.AAC.3